uniref:Uncharacterized protein n=1 Tax=Anopheles atroparvus TaxID=41427 RepID=A0A182JMB0_ANOAO
MPQVSISTVLAKLGGGPSAGAGMHGRGAAAGLGTGPTSASDLQYAQDKSAEYQFLQNVHFPELRNPSATQPHQQGSGGLLPAQLASAGHLPPVSSSAHLLQQQQQQQQHHLQQQQQMVAAAGLVPGGLVGAPSNVAAAAALQQQFGGGLGGVNAGGPADFNHLLPPNTSFFDMALQTKEFQYYWFIKLMETKGLEAANKFTDILRQVPTTVAAAQAIKPTPGSLSLSQQQQQQQQSKTVGPLSSQADLFLDNILNPMKDPLLLGGTGSAGVGPGGGLHSNVLVNGIAGNGGGGSASGNGSAGHPGPGGGGGGAAGGGGSTGKGGILETVDLFASLSSTLAPELPSSQSVPLYRRQAGQNYHQGSNNSAGGGGTGGSITSATGGTTTSSINSSTPDLLDTVHLHQHQQQQQQSHSHHYGMQQPSLVELLEPKMSQQSFLFSSGISGAGSSNGANQFGGNPMLDQQ